VDAAHPADRGRRVTASIASNSSRAKRRTSCTRRSHHTTSPDDTADAGAAAHRPHGGSPAAADAGTRSGGPDRRLTNELLHRAEAEVADSIESSRQADAQSRPSFSALPRPASRSPSSSGLGSPCRSVSAPSDRGRSNGSPPAISPSTCASRIATNWVHSRRTSTA